MRLAWPLVFLVACSVEADTTDTTENVVDPSPYVVPDDEVIEPSLDQPAIERGLAEAISRVIRFDARPVTAAYERALADGDESCPSFYTDADGNQYWASYCQASTGAEFNGYGYYYDYAGMVDENGNIYDKYLVVYASSTIYQRDGSQFAGSGYVVWNELRAPWSTDADGKPIYWDVVQSYVSGSWSAVEPSDAKSWMSDGVTPEISLYMWRSPDDLYSGAYLNGGVSNLGASIDTVSFDNLSLNGYWTCAIEPAGSISIRDDQGYWYDVFFDVSADTGVAPDGSCDGCGQVWYRGELQGQACADFAPWYAWKEGGAW